MIFKKLHINLLSVALLITLLSYSGNENIILPQQFTSEYVVFSIVDDGATFYSTTNHPIENLASVFSEFDYQGYLSAFNSDQKVAVKINQFKSQFLKENRQIITFQTELSSINEVINTLFI